MVTCDNIVCCKCGKRLPERTLFPCGHFVCQKCNEDRIQSCTRCGRSVLLTKPTHSLQLLKEFSRGLPQASTTVLVGISKAQSKQSKDKDPVLEIKVKASSSTPKRDGSRTGSKRVLARGRTKKDAVDTPRPSMRRRLKSSESSCHDEETPVSTQEDSPPELVYVCTKCFSSFINVNGLSIHERTYPDCQPDFPLRKAVPMLKEKADELRREFLENEGKAEPGDRENHHSDEDTHKSMRRGRTPMSKANCALGTSPEGRQSDCASQNSASVRKSSRSLAQSADRSKEVGKKSKLLFDGVLSPSHRRGSDDNDDCSPQKHEVNPSCSRINKNESTNKSKQETKAFLRSPTGELPFTSDPLQNCDNSSSKSIPQKSKKRKLPIEGRRASESRVKTISNFDSDESLDCVVSDSVMKPPENEKKPRKHRLSASRPFKASKSAIVQAEIIPDPANSPEKKKKRTFLPTLATRSSMKQSGEESGGDDYVEFIESQKEGCIRDIEVVAQVHADPWISSCSTSGNSQERAKENFIASAQPTETHDVSKEISPVFLGFADGVEYAGTASKMPELTESPVLESQINESSRKLSQSESYCLSSDSIVKSSVPPVNQSSKRRMKIPKLFERTPPTPKTENPVDHFVCGAISKEHEEFPKEVENVSSAPAVTSFSQSIYLKDTEPMEMNTTSCDDEDSLEKAEERNSDATLPEVPHDKPSSPKKEAEAQNLRKKIGDSSPSISLTPPDISSSTLTEGFGENSRKAVTLANVEDSSTQTCDYSDGAGTLTWSLGYSLFRKLFTRIFEDRVPQTLSRLSFDVVAAQLKRHHIFQGLRTVSPLTESAVKTVPMDVFEDQSTVKVDVGKEPTKRNSFTRRQLSFAGNPEAMQVDVEAESEDIVEGTPTKVQPVVNLLKNEDSLAYSTPMQSSSVALVTPRTPDPATSLASTLFTPPLSKPLTYPAKTAAYNSGSFVEEPKHFTPEKETTLNSPLETKSEPYPTHQDTCTKLKSDKPEGNRGNATDPTHMAPMLPTPAVMGVSPGLYSETPVRKSLPIIFPYDTPVAPRISAPVALPLPTPAAPQTPNPVASLASTLVTPPASKPPSNLTAVVYNESESIIGESEQVLPKKKTSLFLPLDGGNLQTSPESPLGSSLPLKNITNIKEVSSSGIYDHGQMVAIQELTSLMKAKFNRNFTKNTTHLIVPSGNNAVNVTSKFLMALYSGAFILPFKWVKDCLESGIVLAEENYLLTHQGVQRRFLFPPKTALFAGFAFHLSSEMQRDPVNYAALKNLMEFCDCEIVDQVEDLYNLSSLHKIVIRGDGFVPPPSKGDDEVVHVSYKWFYICLTTYKIHPLNMAVYPN